MPISAHITGGKPNESGRQSSTVGGGGGKVPNSKKPRSRPPVSLRDKLGVLSQLPPYSGPYSVGCMDIEVPVANPRTISNIKRNGRHVLQLETVLFTLYYPASFGTGRGKDPSGRKNWSRETWLPRPRFETARGYANFAGIPESASIAYFAATSMLTKLPAYRNSPPARHWPPDGNAKQNGYKVKNKEGPPPEGGSTEPKFPLLFFSHGLGGNRTCYSSMCGEYASYGFVVCAVEHRDGSGPRTFVNHVPEGFGNRDEKEKAKGVDHSEEEERKGYHHIDYLFPKDNPIDTSPLNEKGVDRELRSAQMELRLSEFEEAYRVLCEICDGKGEEIARQNLRREGFVGGSSRGLEGVDWSIWKDRFHVDKITASGHSFGAATVTEILRHTDRFEHVHAGIIYDIWGAPIKPPEDRPEHRIHSPLLGINSEAFMYWQSNFDAVMSLMQEATEQGAPAFLCTVRGSVHLSQSDFSLLYPHLCSLFLKATVHPQRALDLNISASLEFLRDVTTGAGRSIIQRCMTNEELLLGTPLDQLPDLHKPDDKWIGGRLKVPHEFKTRISAKLQRKLKRKRKHGFYNPGDEIWMHFKPDGGALQDWRVIHKCTTRQLEQQEAGDDSVQPDDKPETAGKPEAQTDGAEDEKWLGQHPALRTEDQ